MGAALSASQALVGAEHWADLVRIQIRYFSLN